MYLLKKPSAVPRDATTSKNVAWQNADFPFGIILNVGLISESYDIKMDGLFMRFMVLLLHLETWDIKHEIFS